MDIFDEAEALCAEKHNEVIHEAIKALKNKPNPEPSDKEHVFLCGVQLLYAYDSELHRNLQQIEGHEIQIERIHNKQRLYKNSNIMNLGRSHKDPHYSSVSIPAINHRLESLEIELEQLHKARIAITNKISNTMPCRKCTVCKWPEYLNKWEKLFGPPTPSELNELLEDIVNYGRTNQK